MKFHHYTAGLLVLLSFSLFTQAETTFKKKCAGTIVETYIVAEKSFDIAQSCSAVKAAVKFASKELFLDKKAVVSIKYETLSSIGYEFPNNFNKEKRDNSQLHNRIEANVQLDSFYSEQVHSSDKLYLGLNVQTSERFSDRHRVMVLKALHHSTIVYKTIHSLLSSYLIKNPNLNISYAEVLAIAYIGQLDSISPALREIIIDENQDIVMEDFGYQDLINHTEGQDDLFIGVNSFLKYTNGSLKVKDLLKL
ncbi:hypothetical protein [Halobacteriovorax sp.]|uniref:hypothetical protein n=1 Tax=Halobacteriovorax sp. TaxID=2020862 RepID=UPI003569BFF5